MTTQSAWYEAKGMLTQLFGMERDHLHVHLGLAAFFFVAILLHRRERNLLYAWLAVLVLQVINEALDARDWMRWTGTINWSEPVKDTVLTLFWPSVIVLAGPRIVRWQSPAKEQKNG
jgi:hypothetical protein